MHITTELNYLSELFPGLEFDEETHTYWVDKVKTPSTSSKVAEFYEPFDSIPIATRYAEKHNFFTQDVLDAWEGNALIATDRGTIVHIFGEDYAKWRYYGIGKKPKVLCKQTLGIVQFYDSLPLHIYPVCLELQMYNKLFHIAGTCDILLFNAKTNEYYLSDYKTNGSLTSKYPQDPLYHIPAKYDLVQDNFGKYSVQFSIYQLMLEKVGINVTQRILIWLQEQEDKKLYKTFRTIDLTKDIEKYFLTQKTI